MSEDSVNLSQDKITTPRSEASVPVTSQSSDTKGNEPCSDQTDSETLTTVLPDTTDGEPFTTSSPDTTDKKKEADGDANKIESEEKTQDVMKVEEECDQEAAKSIEIKEKEPKEWTMQDLNKEFRKFNIDLQPRVCFQNYFNGFVIVDSAHSTIYYIRETDWSTGD